MKNKRKKIIKTAHGNLKTPFFMPDATRGYIKLTDNSELREAGVEAMVVNTFHLYLQPGTKLIKKANGIHKFMNWDGPLLSDSGGFQVFSLIHQNSKMGKIYDDKVIFKSPIDGSRHEMTPEKSIQIQFDLGVDMMVCFDDCPPNGLGKDELKKSVDRTISWARRCKAEYARQVKRKKSKVKSYREPLLFGVVQGGNYKDLREYCAKELIKLNFDGYGFGARPVDKDGNFQEEILQFTADLIPEDKIRFALGIGLPEDIIRSYNLGWDIFDCVIPTREGRHGKLFYFCHPERSEGSRDSSSSTQNDKKYKTFNINNAKFAKDFTPINSCSKTPELREYTKAYLHHLFKMREHLGYKLASLNNLEFYNNIFKGLRD